MLIHLHLNPLQSKMLVVLLIQNQLPEKNQNPNKTLKSLKNHPNLLHPESLHKNQTQLALV
jgi:hypothetical protein